MSVAAIYKALAKDFKIGKDHVGYAYESLAAGLRPAYLAHFRRAEIGNLGEGALRRMDRRRRQLEDVDARRANVLKTLEGDEHAKDRATVEGCLERWQLDNLLVAMRKPEPEVQLALDRGLGALADALVAPAGPGEAVDQRAGKDEAEDGSSGEHESGEHEPQPAAEEAATDEAATDEAATDEAATDEAATDEAATDEAGGDAAPADVSAAAAEPSVAAKSADVSPQTSVEESPAPAAEAEHPAAAVVEEAAAASEQAPAPATEPAPEPAKGKKGKRGKPEPSGSPAFHAPSKVESSPELARVCQPFVNPDRDLHTEEQVLEGALRILSDRLGRDARLRATLRRLALKSARLSVRPLGDEKKLSRSRSLLKLDATMNQLQGHRLLALRQALMQRQVALQIRFDPALALPKVRTAMGRRPKAIFSSVFDAVSERAFWRRLVPFLEEEVKHELRERADEEATRFLSQSLRHVLLAPVYGRRPVAGVDVNPKGDWTVAILDGDGVPQGPELKLEIAVTELGKLAEALSEPMRQHGVRAIAVGNGKSSRETIRKLREVIQVLGAEAMVFPVNEAGLSSYANSELARQELGELSVPARMAVSLGRRLQDPLCELLKTDVRHLGLGREQSVVSKANLRRLVADSIESCVAFIGCDVNAAPLHVLRHVPGIDFDIAKKIVERRSEKPFTSREELRTEGILDGVRWTNAAGFLKVAGAEEPFERATVHPDLYDVARAICAKAGVDPKEAVGHSDPFRRSHPEGDVPEPTWRDIARSLGRGSRDGRSRLYHPRLLAPDTEPDAIQKDTIVEGIVVNVTSFGVFVDLGVPRDGMIHISELSSRYVRDARELLSVGQIIRARILSGEGQRIELSLKNVPDERRERRGPRPGAGKPVRGRGGDRGRRGGESERKDVWPEYQPVVRAARTRRDGLAGASAGGRGRGGKSGGPGRGGQGRGGPGQGGPRRGGGRRDRDESYDAEAVKRSKQSAGNYNPFASFFKERGEEEPEASE